MSTHKEYFIIVLRATTKIIVSDFKETSKWF